MEIRQILDTEIAAMARMEGEIFPLGATEDMLRAILTGRGSAALGAFREGELLGYAWFQFVMDEGYVGNVAVAEPYRRAGIGRALTEAMLALGRERGLAFLTLEVRESNLPARRLYERCGFETVGLRKNYYERPGEDAVLMTAFIGNEE